MLGKPSTTDPQPHPCFLSVDTINVGILNSEGIQNDPFTDLRTHTNYRNFSKLNDGQESGSGEGRGGPEAISPRPTALYMQQQTGQSWPALLPVTLNREGERFHVSFVGCRNCHCKSLI